MISDEDAIRRPGTTGLRRFLDLQQQRDWMQGKTILRDADERLESLELRFKYLARFEKLGLETAITEVDVRMIMPVDNVKLQAQAQGYSVLLQGCLLARRCNSFTVWGFTDKYSWVPGWFDGEGAANLLDENFAPKPAYQELQAILALTR